jgi:PHD/YefM family antitoxin component YafN of YafNO toxin-antitoxin module
MGVHTLANTWQAAEARHRFSEIVDAAVEGKAQFVKRRDGKEVVVVSRDYFEKTRPTLKTWLLTEGFAEDGEDAFDKALRDIRREGSPFLIDERGDPDSTISE